MVNISFCFIGYLLSAKTIYRKLPAVHAAPSGLPTTCSQLNTRLTLRPGPRLPNDDRRAYCFDGCEEQVLGKRRRPAHPQQRRNEGRESAYNRQKDARKDIRDPVCAIRKQPTRHNHGDGYRSEEHTSE